MSITVSLTLEDGMERAGFERLMRDIDAYRAQKQQDIAAHIKAAMEAPYGAAQVETRQAIDAEFVEQPAAVEDPTPKVEAGNVPTEDQMMAAVRNYLRQYKLPATMELLKKHGVSKATDPMTDEVKVALFADLTK